MMERLQKILAGAGIASRRQSEKLISEGRVSVNGQIVARPGTKADPFKDHIRIDGKRIGGEKRKVHVLLYKPKGYMTTRHDPEGRPTVMDLVAGVKTPVFPVGRLDYDTEGLIIMTNDGDLANGLMHPSNQVEKVYHAKVKGIIPREKLKRLSEGGISLPTGKTAPCHIHPIRHTDLNQWVELVLHEGKTREVRQLLERVGHPVVKLKRVAYAFLKVGDQPLGSYRYLSLSEVRKLKSVVQSKGSEQRQRKRSRRRVK